MASRALPDLVARIRVDSSGVDASLNSLIGGLGRANLAMTALGAAIGLFIVGGKSMIDIAEKEDAAHRSLAQAVDYYNSNLGKNVAAHKVWVENSKQAAARSKEFAAAQRAVMDATYAANVAQAKYTHALYEHGANSEQAVKAEGALLAAKQRLAAAQERENKLVGGASGAWANVPAQQKRAAISLEAYQKILEKFLNDNKAFISDTAEATTGFASFIRAGLSQTETLKDMNRALDLSAIQHISLTDAVKLVTDAEQGRLKGLIALGIASKDYLDKNGKALTGAKLVAAALADLDKKGKGGRETLSAHTQVMNEMGAHWTKFAEGPGKELSRALDDGLSILNLFMTLLEKMGSDNQVWDAIDQRLSDMARWIHDHIIQPLQDAWAWLYRLENNGASPPSDPPAQAQFTQGRASGGPVVPGGSYTVGEEGPEQLVMGARGGYVIPNRGGGGHSRLTVLPLIFSPIPPNREQIRVMSDMIRRFDREHR